jgi:hypothetical protein
MRADLCGVESASARFENANVIRRTHAIVIASDASRDHIVRPFGCRAR